MIYMTCKCGKCESLNSGMSPASCDGCNECGTNFYKKPLEPHEWKTMYDENTGKPYRRCKNCYQRKRGKNR